MVAAIVAVLLGATGAVPPEAARGLVERRPGVDAVDVALLVPRAVLLLPRTLLALAAAPLEALVGAAERHRVPQRIVAATHNPPRTAGVEPSLAYLSDLGGAFGATIFHRDLLGGGETLALTVTFGGGVRQRYRLAFDAERVGDSPAWLRAAFVYGEDPSDRFFGLGDPPTAAAPVAGTLDPRAAAVSTRYAISSLATALAAGVTVDAGGVVLRPGGHVHYANRNLGPADEEGRRSIETVYDVGALTGFEDVAETVEVLATLALHAPGERVRLGPTGMRLEVFGGRAVPPGDFGYWRWGAEAGGWIDLHRGLRLLRLRVGVTGVEGAPDEVPFFVMPTLGGEGRLRGFASDRFRDETAVLVTAEYAYFASAEVVGLLFVDAGRVARDPGDLAGAPLDDWHASAGFGARFSLRGEPLFRALFAYGDAVRLYVTTDLGHLVDTGALFP